MITKEEFEEWTDDELAKEWNRLETLKLSPYVEMKMDLIEDILQNDRRVIAWDSKGTILEKDEYH